MAVWAFGGVEATCTSSNDGDRGTRDSSDGVNGGSGSTDNGGGGATVGGSSSSGGSGGSGVSSIPPSSSPSSSSSSLLQLVHVFRVHDQGVNCVAANAGTYTPHYSPLFPTLS